MTQEQISLLKQLLSTSKLLLNLTNNLNSVEEFENNNYVFDNILSNVAVIYELSQKLPQKLKTKELNSIDWQKIDYYEKIIRNDTHQLDTKTIWIAIKQDLPFFTEKLEKILAKFE